MTEKMNIEDLSKDSVIVNWPFCNVFFLALEREGHRRHHNTL